MKKNFFPAAAVAVLLGFALSGCVLTKTLTPQAIKSDIVKLEKNTDLRSDTEGMKYLTDCQFYISKDIELSYHHDEREVRDIKSGIARAERVIIRRTIKIAKSTPGIIRSKNNDGEDVDGYRFIDFRNGQTDLQLFILFEGDNDNAICFTAIYNDINDKFELITNEAEYDGVIYKISYSGEEMPYLKYKLLEKTTEENEKRRASGRKVGS